MLRNRGKNITAKAGILGLIRESCPRFSGERIVSTGLTLLLMGFSACAARVSDVDSLIPSLLEGTPFSTTVDAGAASSATIALSNGSISRSSSAVKLGTVTEAVNSASAMSSGTLLGTAVNTSGANPLVTIATDGTGNYDNNYAKWLAAGSIPSVSSLHFYASFSGTSGTLYSNGQSVAPDYGANLTMNGAGATGIGLNAGKVGTGLTFGSANGTVRADATGLSSLTDFTFSSWVYWTGSGFNSDTLFLLKNSSTGKFLSITPNYHSPRWGTDDGFSVATGTVGTLSSYNDKRIDYPNWFNNTFMYQEWLHFALKCSGLTCQIYINGKPFDTTFNLASGYSISGIAPDTLVLGVDESGSSGYFHGSIDETAFWKTALSDTEIYNLFESQKYGFVSEYVSPWMSPGLFGDASTSWLGLKWNTYLPYGKGLPAYGDGEAAESATDYPGMASIHFEQGLKLLYQFEEASYTGATGEVHDSSPSHANGTWMGAAAPAAPSAGIFGQAATLLGTSHVDAGVTATDLGIDGNNPRTVAYWAQSDPSGVVQAGMFATGQVAFTNGEFAFQYTGPDSMWRFKFQTWGGNDRTFDLPCIQRWCHFAFTHDGTTLKIYVNGVVKVSQAMTFNTQTGHNIFIGSWDGGSNTSAKGKVDEFGIWNRALTGPEVVALYRRGASKLSFSARTCADQNCANTSSAWVNSVSESDNRNASSLWLASSASVLFNNLTSPFSVTQNPYFQFRALLQTTDPDPALGPDFQSVQTNPAHYNADAPYVTITQGVGDWISIVGITPTYGAAGCSGGIKLQLSASSDGSASWLYWNGSKWVTASAATVAQATPIALLTSTVLSQFPVQAASGLSMRVYLLSNGSTPCELESLKVAGLKSK